jgi:26S proteasome regulatory subunit T5
MEVWKDEEVEQEELFSKTNRPRDKCAVVKTSTKRTIFLPNLGLLEESSVEPGERVCVNREVFTLSQKLPRDYDPRVKAMEVIEKPTDTYSDIGGLEKQIQELMEAVSLPFKNKQKFDSLGIKPPKGVLLYGPPGTGKTLLARACAAEIDSAFLKLAGPQLVQSYIGDGSKLVRDAFALAKHNSPTVIFIDEIDAIGARRTNSQKSPDREVHRTLIELLNQMDGFSSLDQVVVIAATNRVDMLDPALLRSGRIDKKIEFPEPDEHSRTHVMQIHARKMHLASDVDFIELGRTTDGFNCAMCAAVCTEAAMCALRRNDDLITHEDFIEAINEVQVKKKGTMNYFS